jgi:DNA-binding CsgD family transcriptional regulator
MHSLSLNTVRRLMQALEQIHSANSLQQFPAIVFTAIGQLIEGTGLTLDTFSLKTEAGTDQTSENRPAPSDVKNRIMELMPTHPLMPAARAGAKGAIRISDCIRQHEFEQSPQYSEVFVRLGQRYQTVVMLDIPGHIAGVTVDRDKEFSETDVLLLNLLAPQIALAHRNVQRLDSLRAAAKEVVPAPQDLERVGLTPREAEVLHWVIKGKQDGVIASILKISVRTVHQHIARILRKLQSETRGSAGYEAMAKLKDLEPIPRTAGPSHLPHHPV